MYFNLIFFSSPTLFILCFLYLILAFFLFMKFQMKQIFLFHLKPFLSPAGMIFFLLFSHPPGMRADPGHTDILYLFLRFNVT